MSGSERGAHVIDLRHAEVVEILGPTVQFLTPPGADDDGPSVMRGMIPAGVSVPLHSHRDPETFLMISGEIDGLAEAANGFEGTRLRPGDIFHVPGEVKHAWRNQSQAPAVMTIVSTNRMARFFREVGAPARSRPGGPPSPETIRHFQEVAARYGYWNATPEENARVGLAMPAV